MKKYLITVIMFFICNIAIAAGECIFQVVENSDNTSTQFFYKNSKVIAARILEDGVFVSQKGKIPDGIAKMISPKGITLAELRFKNNQLNGISKEYYDSGEIYFLKNYKDNRLNGVTKEFYKDGDLHFEWIYHDNKLDGNSVEYDEDGRLKGKLTYRKGVKEYIFYY